ncbi:hypothetical protein [uncultured Oscillibacter sp.]|uniref:hypothetical protein n=1 Tax=uncultured Oscillibacter sp. TaxID=876091 RepID=UPI0026E36E9C|nr:hypothetical protein [uncultured Oscillibacter sp.]
MADGYAIRRNCGGRLQRLAVRTVKGYALTAQVLEKDPPFFSPAVKRQRVLP